MKQSQYVKIFFFLIVFPTFVSASVVHVPGDYSTIQSAIDAAATGDLILIADGIYSGSENYDIDFKGKAIEVKSLNGPENCVVDCMSQGRGFIFQNGEGYNSIIEGITVKNGLAQQDNGGGILCMNASSPTISNCHIKNNSADGNGGGIACFGASSPVLYKCIISSNSSEGAYGGGGILCWDSSLTITDCVITGNNASWEGGGVFSYFSYPVISNCLIIGNSAEKGGGLLIAFSGKSCSKSINRLNLNRSDNPLILNSTIADNHCGMSGGGIAFYDGFAITIITNSIIWNNSSNQIHGADLDHIVTYSDIEDGFPGEGNMDSDPDFCNGPLGDYYLSQIASGQPLDSPCINAGSDLAQQICFTIPEGEICMDELTTRTDSVSDTGIVDIGYHYSQYSSSQPTVTPTPTSTPDECTNLGCEVVIPAENFSPGDEFYCDVTVCNPFDNTFNHVPLYSVLDVYGEIYLLTPLILDVIPGISSHTVIPMFVWPDNTGEGQATIYAAMTNENISELFGDFGCVTFSWTN